MTTEQLNEIRRFNQNIEWLKTSHVAPEMSDLVSMKDAMKILSRQRTWIQTRMVKDLENGQDSIGLLVRDVDWIREGNRIMFKKDSLLRIKKDFLTAIGNKYDNI